MYKNVSKMMYTYGGLVLLVLLMFAVDFKTFVLILSLGINTLTSKYVFVRNFL